jgi:hypothetical protein
VKELDSTSKVRKQLFDIKRSMLLNPPLAVLYELMTGLFVNGLFMVSLIIIYE